MAGNGSVPTGQREQVATTHQHAQEHQNGQADRLGRLIIKGFLLVGLLAVGASLGVISYRHGIFVALMHGQDALSAKLFPAGIDGGLLVSAAAQIAPRTRASTRAAAKLTFLVCLAATLAMNGLAAGEGAGWLAMTISAVPGLIFVLAIHSALLLIKDLTRKTTERDVPGMWAKLGKSWKASRARARRRTKSQREARETRANATRTRRRPRRPQRLSTTWRERPAQRDVRVRQGVRGSLPCSVATVAMRQGERRS